MARFERKTLFLIEATSCRLTCSSMDFSFFIGVEFFDSVASPG